MSTNRKRNYKPRTKYQKKKVQPAHKSMRGVPETGYGELKKNTAYSLTPTAIQLMKELSQELKISASELLEQIARKKADIKKLLNSDSRTEEP